MFYNCCCIAVSVMASDKVDSYCCSCCLILDDPLTCSCWASWFSSPSTMQENLSLLFFSAVTVMAARILSKLKKKKNPKANRQINKHVYPFADRTFTHTFHPLLFSLNVSPSLCLCAIWSISHMIIPFCLSVLVTAITLDKKWGFGGNAKNQRMRSVFGWEVQWMMGC